MKHVLLLRLEGPLQSWGTQSRFTDRDTGREPSKSGVIGLLCAALGRTRDADLSDLTALEMAVRVDREGTVLHDFHTAGGGSVPGIKTYGVTKASGASPETAVSHRHYLTDASFLVALGGEEDLLRQIETALCDPVWPLFLGRKSCVPSSSVLVGFRQADSPIAALESEPWAPRSHRDKRPERLRIVSETTHNRGHPRSDIPLCFEKSARRFEIRHVAVHFIEAKENTHV